MEVARPLLLLLLPLLLWTGCNPSAAADCNMSETAPMFTTTVTWTFDPQTDTCKMQKQESNGSSSPTTIKTGETKTIAGLGNDCLYFGCWDTGPRIDALKSSCFLKEGCCVNMSEVNKPPSCMCRMDLRNITWPIVPNNNNSRSFNLSTQYICNQTQGQGGLSPLQLEFQPFSIYHNAHWPFHPPRPYHPYYPARWPYYSWYHYHPSYSGFYPSNPAFSPFYAGFYPSNPAFSPFYAGPWVAWSYPPFYSSPSWPPYQWNYADSHDLTDAGSGGNTSLTGCSNNGTTVAEGAVTKSDACGKTVCQGGKLVTQNTGDGNGCAYEPSNQCIKEGSNITIHEQTTCFTVSCQKNGTETQLQLDTQRSGCFYDGKCYPGGSQVTKVASCQKVRCQQDTTTGQFSLSYDVTGCVTFDGRCVGLNIREISDCNVTTCKQNAQTGDFFLNVTKKACVSLTEPRTCRFDHDESDETDNDTCVFNTCKTYPTNHWETHFKTTENCSALSTKECETDIGIPGCRHLGHCHPVKSVLYWDNCTQFVCYSEDGQLSNGNKSNARPAWKPRALGCYGPPGCMHFGEDFVDIHTNNTYRCGYNISGLGHKYSQILSYCTMPSALPIAVGTVVRSDLTYYACTPEGMRTLKINQTVPIPGEVADCGHNPVTNEIMYPGNQYNWNTSFCKTLHNCSKTCTYFDTPCYIDDKETDAKTRVLGQTFTLGKATCACTQDNGVNNYKPPNGSRANTPSLCAEDGVQGGACKDLDSPEVIRQWGELWVRSNTNPLEICTCNPATRKAFCSVLASDVVDLPITAGNT